MKIRQIFEKLKETQSSNISSVENLYLFSRWSLIALLLFSSGIIFTLYPLLHQIVWLWYIPLAILIGYRLYTAYLFQSTPALYSKKKWYRQFVILAYLTGFLFSSIGFVYIHFIDANYHIFILAVIIGVSSGATLSLFPDIRINIHYISILTIPLIITLVFITNTPQNTILAVFLLLYYFTQIALIYILHVKNKESQTLKSSQSFLHNFIQNAPIGILMYNKDMIVIDKNRELDTVFHHGEDNIIGLSLDLLPDKSFVPTLKKALEEGIGFYTGSYQSLYQSNLYLEIKAYSYHDNATNRVTGIAIIENKTKEHHALKQLEYMANHDILTGLLNRRGFKTYMDLVILDPKHETHYSILFYLDLNQFKSINDSLGHAVGDQVLVSVARRLQQKLDKQAIISRLGGDEFNILIPHVTVDKKVALVKSQEHANTIQSVFLNPCIIEDMTLHVKTSIGIVLLEPGEKDKEELIRHADLTMYKAKNAANHTSYYDPGLDKMQKETFTLQQHLVNAATNRDLKLFFQPVVEMKNEKILSAEVLLRWQHPEKGLLGPERFIPLAIKAGLLSKITWWLVENVCRQITQWKREGIWRLNYIAININSAQLIENDFVKLLVATLKKYNIHTQEIMLEITERSLIDNFANTQSIINKLKSHGIKCAIDDFGTGYSSLSYLKKLSLDTLKIDREFIRNIEEGNKEYKLLSTILNIGRLFNYHLVIEGVEHQRQKELLLALDEKLNYQGYLFSKPLCADEFTQKHMLA